MMTKTPFVLCPLLLSAAAWAHNPLLPAPQEVRYGPGKLAVTGLDIRFGSAAAAEDRFAANELAAWLHERSGSRAEVWEGQASGRAIVLRRTGGVEPLALPDESAGKDSRESYTIRITPQGGEVTARSSAGLYYAAETLRQLIEGSGAGAFLPEVEVRDWPSLAYRGYMMDMSHAQLPTVEDVKRQLDFLARFKTNQYYFYSEASIELKGYPLLIPEARFTQAQVKEIVDYARRRHIDVIPNVEWYGHLHDLFRLERYADLAVVPHDGEFNRQDPRVKPLLEDWAAQLSRLFPSPFFHVGFDETWLIQREAAKRKVAPEQLYLGQLKEVVAILEKLGKRPMAWADMLQKFPQIVAETPRSLVSIPWHYFPLKDDEYDKLLAPFSQAGRQMIVQSAVINWAWLAPDYETSFRNVDLLLAAGRRHKTVGLIQSGWTDDTHNLNRTGRPAWAYCSASGWQSGPVDRAKFFGDYADVLYPAGVAAEVARGLDALARAEQLLQKSTSGETIAALWGDPFTPARLKHSREHKAELRQTRLAAEEAQERLRNSIEGGVDVGTLKSMLVAAKLVDVSAMKHIYAMEIADFWDQFGAHPDPEEAWPVLYMEVGFKYHTRTSDMMDAMAELRAQFQEAWLTEFTPFRLGVGTAKFDAEYQSWWKLQRRVLGLTEELKNGLPPLRTITEGLW